MNRRKINLSAVILWSVVAYAIALLTYCTMKGVLSATTENISAFGSILGACGAFFAAFVATYLYDDWRLQASFDLKKQHVNEISYLLAQSYDELNKMQEILANLKNVKEYKIFSEKYYSFKANDLRDEFFSKQLNIKMLDRLNKSKNEIFNVYAKYQTHLIYLVDNFNRIQKSYIRYYDKFNSEMSNAERILILNKGSFPMYILPSEKNAKEVGLLNTHIYLPIQFDKEDISYIYNNIFELIINLIEIYKDLEAKVLDSIDLTKND